MVSNMIKFLSQLRCDSGGYAETLGTQHSIRSTLSVIKALKGLTQEDVSASGYPWVIDFVCNCHCEPGGFSIAPGENPTTYDTANGLILLQNLGQQQLLNQYLDKALEFMSDNAVNQFDHFMLVAAYEECDVKASVPQKTIEFMQNLLLSSIEASKPSDVAIATAALIRAGQTIPAQQLNEVTPILLNSQNTIEGGFGDNNSASLFVTYCVMRTLVLLKLMPNFAKLSDYQNLLKSAVPPEAVYTDVPDGPGKAGAIYMNLGISDWVSELQSGITSAARGGKKN